MFTLPHDIQQAIRQTAAALRGGLASLVFILVFSGCSTSSEEAPVYEEVQFSTQWESVATRSTVENQWSEGDTLYIRMYDTTLPYKVQSNGTLTAVDKAFFWASPNAAQVSGYYSPVQPFSSSHTFKIETGQSSANGFSRSDALYAKPVTVSYGETARLTYCHLTAWVNLNVTYSADLGPLNMTGANIKFVNQQNVSGTVDPTTGAVAQHTLQSTRYQITPEGVDGSNADVKKVRALLVPQCGYDIPFITVTFIDEDTQAITTYTYTPTASAPLNLEAGKQYTFNLTLTDKGLELDTQKTTEWQEGSSDTVISANEELAPSTSSAPAWSEGSQQHISSTN